MTDHVDASEASQPADERGKPSGGLDAQEFLAAEHDHLRELFARVSKPDEDRPAVLRDIMQAWATHLAVEKQMLLPALKERVESPELASHLSREHDRVEHILTLLERRKVNSPDVPSLVDELLHMTDRHLAWSESSLFPALRASLTPEQLGEMGAAMASDERRMLTHAHPALPDSGPVAAIARKLAEAVDQVRDSSADVGRTAG